MASRLEEMQTTKGGLLPPLAADAAEGFGGPQQAFAVIVARRFKVSQSVSQSSQHCGTCQYRDSARWGWLGISKAAWCFGLNCKAAWCFGLNCKAARIFARPEEEEEEEEKRRGARSLECVRILLACVLFLVGKENVA